MSYEFRGIDSNWRTDLSLGIAAGALFIFLNLLNPDITIGMPIFIMANNFDLLLIVCIVAPLTEEAAFRAALMNGVNFVVNSQWVAVVLSAIVFSLFHWTAYGLSMNAAFIGAGLFGLITGMMVLHTNSIISGIAMHILVNGYLINKQMNFLVVGM